MAMTKGFQPKTIKSLLQGAKKAGIKIDMAGDVEAQLIEAVKTVHKRIGSLYRLADYFGTSKATVYGCISPGHKEKRAFRKREANASNSSCYRPDKPRQKFCRCCGAPLPQKPYVTEDYETLVWLCRNCHKRGGKAPDRHDTGLFTEQEQWSYLY
jgi:RNase P subunit RPR2